MKPERQADLESALASCEQALSDRLREVLPGVAEAGALLFFPTRHRPDGVMASWVPAESDRLYDAALECLALRDQLGIPREGSVGQLFIAACQEAADSRNAHRRGPRRLALALLASLDASRAP